MCGSSLRIYSVEAGRMVELTVEMTQPSLNLKNPETYRLAQRLAKVTGESMTQAVTVALAERLTRVEPQAQSKSLAQDLMEIGADCAKRLSARTKRLDHGDLLYDKRGLPR